MLENLKSYGMLHLAAASNSFTLFCRKPLSVILTGLVIASALTLPVLFFLFADNIAQLSEGWQEGGRITLYLKTSSSAKEDADLLKKVRGIEGVASASYKSRADSLKDLQKQEGMQDIMRYLPNNPLPAVIEISPRSTINSPEKMRQLFDRLKTFPQIEQGRQDMEWIQRAEAFYQFVREMAHALTLVLGLAVVLIVANTLSLIVQNRQEEIQVLKLIGAKDSLILRPFLYLGIYYGILGAILSILFVSIFMVRINYSFQELLGMYDLQYHLLGLSVKQAYGILWIAAMLGWLGAWLSGKKQLLAMD